MANTLGILLVTSLVLVLAWLVVFGVVFVDKFKESTVCKMTLGLGCKNGKIKKPKDDKCL